MNEVYNIDCLEYMKTIDDNYFDLIIIDPPYNIKKAEWDNYKSDEIYYNFILDFMKECQRVSKNNSSTYFFHNDYDKLSELQYRIKRETNYILRNFISWNKYFKESENVGFCKTKITSDQVRSYHNGFHEYILFYTFQNEPGLKMELIKNNILKPIQEYLLKEKDKSKLTSKELGKLIEQKSTHHFRRDRSWNMISEENYNKLSVTGHFKKPYKELLNEYENIKIDNENIRYYFKNQYEIPKNFNTQNWNTSVWNYDFVSSWHPTPKPIELIKNILLHSARPGGKVFNPFNGSENIRLACYELGFDFVGCELDKDYWTAQEERFKSEKAKIDNKFYLPEQGLFEGV